MMLVVMVIAICVVRRVGSGEAQGAKCHTCEREKDAHAWEGVKRVKW